MGAPAVIIIIFIIALPITHTRLMYIIYWFSALLAAFY